MPIFLGGNLNNIITQTFNTFDQIKIENQTNISHTPHSIKPFLSSYLFKKLNKSILFICNNNKTAEILEQNITDLGFPAQSLLYYDNLPYENTSLPHKIIQKRVKTLINIIQKKAMIYIIPLKSFLFPVINKGFLEDNIYSLNVGQKLNREHLISHLTKNGYERVPHIEKVGDFGLRGEVIDIFPPGKNHPIRIELFDIQVEKIKYFNLETQLSFQDIKIDQIDILPLYEFKICEEKLDLLMKRLSSDYPPAMLAKFKEAAIENSFDFNLIPFFYSQNSLLNFFHKQSHNFHLIIDNPSQLASIEKSFSREVKEMFYSSFNIDKIKVQPKNYFIPLIDLLKNEDYQKLQNIDEAKNSFILSNYFTTTPYYSGKIELFKTHLNEWKDYDIYIGCFYEGQKERIKDIFPEMNIIFSHSLEEGFIDHSNKNVLILESEIFGKKHFTHRKKNILLSTAPIESFTDLERGDYVVHINHGVGRYEGIEKISIMGKYKDYIKIIYAEEENLYVPIEQVFLIHKYLGASDGKVRLDRLSGKSWEKRKEKVKRKMEEMAEELAILYEKRKTLPGFKHIVNKKWQYEFEAGFPYEETPDQLKAIVDVKNDMEASFPMDRLICGDVGYGKTEVAMRAAFKAVASGKQVAMFVPTTLLAEQHYQTFLERFDNFSINIKMLSRLVTPKNVKEVITSLLDGSIDILIGTHKILGEKVKFKDLGLLIIDEEQRFGVRHKERIKQLKASIDVLTLSATPIPRTLYMGLSNLRDMSLITTPPVARMPIRTYVMPFNDSVISRAIKKELERNGQIFIIHNRVKTINQFGEMIKNLIPIANIAIAHGQMTPQQMENVFLDFMAGNYDILISTTIIENGIDIPNVNTIIIDRPELLGLSELYQLRGRVGRGNKQGYAYLFYDPQRGLSYNVQKRLEVIEEYTELGSGFKIAMKDLEIRGAGNILGGEQSGFIADVGMELYAKIMKKAVKKVRGLIKEEEIEPLIDISFDGYIPDTYIYEEKEKFSIYKIIMRANEISEIDQLTHQIKDRYGKIPPTVTNLILVSKIKVICKKIGIKEFKENSDGYYMNFIHSNHLNPNKMAELIKNRQGKIYNQGFLIFKKCFDENNILTEILVLISNLQKEEKAAK